MGAISLLSPEYLLSFERWPFHAGTTGSLCPAFAPARLVGLAVKRPSAIALGRRLPIALRAPWEASVTLLEATTPVKLPATRCPPKKRGLDPRQEKGRISTPAPRPLARADHCLRPILHVPCPGTTRSCSKGSRGLSVPSRVPGIFTGTTISPGSWSRQCPDRYTIRAGRNLPDKEFRYLRTVIVTAATFRHRAGVRPYTSSRDLAQPCVFGKQSPGPFLCGSPKGERPLSRSYRTILPSSLTTNHPCASVCSTRSRVSVCGTVPRAIVLSGFSWG